jgi:hypothetical protein
VLRQLVGFASWWALPVGRGPWRILGGGLCQLVGDLEDFRRWALPVGRGLGEFEVVGSASWWKTWRILGAASPVGALWTVYIVIYCRVDPPFSPVAPGVHLEIVPDAAARLTQ